MNDSFDYYSEYTVWTYTNSSNMPSGQLPTPLLTGLGMFSMLIFLIVFVFLVSCSYYKQKVANIGLDPRDISMLRRKGECEKYITDETRNNYSRRSKSSQRKDYDAFSSTPLHCGKKVAVKSRDSLNTE